jgi:hypothetical protein
MELVHKEEEIIMQEEEEVYEVVVEAWEFVSDKLDSLVQAVEGMGWGIMVVREVKMGVECVLAHRNMYILQDNQDLHRSDECIRQSDHHVCRLLKNNQNDSDSQ